MKVHAIHLALLVCIFICCGCDVMVGAVKQSKSKAGKTFHENFGWKAEEFFNDAKVIALCRAIEENDLAKMDELITAGVEVNTIGKDGMTPLLWAFPDNKLPRFEKLLKAGADPNVMIESNLSVEGGFRAETAVTHLAAESRFPGHFQAVMEHGGDPNLKNWMGYDSLHIIVKTGLHDAIDRIAAALKHGANIDSFSDSGATPTMVSVAAFGQYDLACKLIDMGARIDLYSPGRPTKLVHEVLLKDRNIHLFPANEQAAFYRLVEKLEGMGEDVEQARKDCERWAEWGRTMPPKEVSRRMRQEVQDRLDREQRAQEAKGDGEEPN